MRLYWTLPLNHSCAVFGCVFLFICDLGTEELGHLEMVGALIHQLTREMSADDVKRAGLETYFVDHTAGVYPQFASGYPWSASTMQVTGDVITDLSEDMAAEAASQGTTKAHFCNGSGLIKKQSKLLNGLFYGTF